MGNLQCQSASTWFSTHISKFRSRDIDSTTTPSRIISRSGRVKIRLDQLSLGKRQRYWKNPLTTLLDLKWRWIFLIFVLGFFTTWFTFAVAYYIIADYHGDIGDLDPSHTRCLINVGSFTAALLFSVESQHTIGYGYRSPSSECSAAIFTVFIQFIFGLAVQCIIAGLVVAKLQMGGRSPKAILFSQKACIGKCKDNACLMVRVGNSGRSELAGARGFGIIVERQKTRTEEERLTETYLEFLSENDSSNINLLWPAVIHCAIEEDVETFIARLRKPTTELIVTIEGTMCSTGQMLQLRTSYIAPEIEVGKQFVDISPRLVLNDEGRRGFYHEVDYAEFDVMQADNNWDNKLCPGKTTS